MVVNDDSPGSRLAIKVTPNAGRNEITGVKEGVLHVKIAASPEKGKANKELINFLAERLGIKKSDVLIVKGQASRHKSAVINGMSREEILKRLQ